MGDSARPEQPAPSVGEEVGDPGGEVIGQEGVPVPDRLRRLWAPHRLAYIKGEPGTGRPEEIGCPFCRIPTLPDGEGLVLARGARVYAVLNLHPYNPGHLMIVPFRHVAGYEDLTADEVAEVGRFTQQALVALRTASAPHGFNVGLNLGGVAGGSLASHLHQHVVPRWGGDANYITVIGHTKVMPALLAETRDLLAASWPR